MNVMEMFVRSVINKTPLNGLIINVNFERHGASLFLLTRSTDNKHLRSIAECLFSLI